MRAQALRWIPTVAAVVVVVVMIFGQLQLARFNPDEHPYIAVAHLLDAGRLYRDFGYNHMPYLPHAYRALQGLLPDLPLLVVGRALTAGFVAVAALALGWLSYALTSSRAVGIAAMIAFALNTLVFASQTVPIKDFAGWAFSLTALALFLAGARRPEPAPWRLAAAGLTFGLAVAFKLPYVLLGLAFAAAIAWRAWQEGPRVGLGLAGPFAAGSVVALLPLAGLALPHLDAFWFCNVEFHRLSGKRIALSAAIGVERSAIGAKLAFLRSLCGGDPTISLTALVVAGLTAVAAIQVLLGGRERRPAWELVLIGSALAVTPIIGLTPTPSWPHHFAVFVPFALAWGAACLGTLPGDARTAGQVAFAATAGMAVIVNGGSAAAGLAALTVPDAWVAAGIRAEGREIARLLGPAGPGDRIATLAPIHALEAGYGIYPELSTGPFFYFVGDLVPPAERQRFHITSASGLDGLLGAAPPAGIVTGLIRNWYIDLDRPFETFARQNGYSAHPLPNSPIVVYKAPANPRPTGHMSVAERSGTPPANALPRRALPSRLVEAFTSRVFPDPTAVVAPPGQQGRCFVAERAGRIIAVSGTGADEQATLFLDLKSQTRTFSSPPRPGTLTPPQSGGLLGLAFHPKFKETGHFFVSYVAGVPATLTVSRFAALPGYPHTADATSEHKLLLVTLPYAGNAGGGLMFGRDGHLYVGVGDGGGVRDPDNRAQDPMQFLGKVLRIDVDVQSAVSDYTIPLGNPLRGMLESHRDEVFALGFSDPRALAEDPATGRLWLADATGGRGEELNLVLAGHNYGWDLTAGLEPPQPRLTAPAWTYGAQPGGAIAGVTFSRSPIWPALTGKALVADGESGNLWAVTPEAVAQATRLLGLPGGFAALGTDAEGTPLLLGRDGHLYRLD